MNNRLHTERQLLVAKIRLDRLVMQEKFMAKSAADGNAKFIGIWKEYATHIVQKINKYPLWAGAALAAVVALLPRHAIGNTLGRGAVMVERMLSQPEGLSLLARMLPSVIPALLEIIQSVRGHDEAQDSDK